MIDRRGFLAGAAAFGALASCAPAGPGAVTIVAKGAAGMNAGADGGDRPLTVQVVQMRGAGAFDTADYFALQDPATALGGDFIKADQIVLTASEPVTKTIGLDAGTMMIGVIAGFREPGGKAFRAKSAVTATKSAAFSVEVGASGISLTPA